MVTERLEHKVEKAGVANVPPRRISDVLTGNPFGVGLLEHLHDDPRRQLHSLVRPPARHGVGGKSPDVLGGGLRWERVLELHDEAEELAESLESAAAHGLVLGDEGEEVREGGEVVEDEEERDAGECFYGSLVHLVGDPEGAAPEAVAPPAEPGVAVGDAMDQPELHAPLLRYVRYARSPARVGTML